jgi:hypothetical protein
MTNLLMPCQNDVLQHIVLPKKLHIFQIELKKVWIRFHSMSLEMSLEKLQPLHHILSYIGNINSIFKDNPNHLVKGVSMDQHKVMVATIP